MKSQDTETPVLVVQTIPQAATEHLRSLILSGRLAPGQRLLQEDLAEQLGISRTPIREALQQLANEGLVNISSYRGAYVATFSESDLKEVYSVRVALESHAASLAAENITDEDLERLEAQMREMGVAFRAKDFVRLLEAHHKLHASIYAIAGQQRLNEIITQYLGLSNVYQRMALSLGRGASDPIREHTDIIETLRRRDPEGSARIIRAHLQLTMSELLSIFARQQRKPA